MTIFGFPDHHRGLKSDQSPWTQWVRTRSRPGHPPAKIVPLVFHSVWHALGMDYGRCRDGVNIRSIYADATLCFLNLRHRLGCLPLCPHSVHTPSKLCLNSVRTECVLSASCVHTCVFRRIVVNVFLLT